MFQWRNFHFREYFSSRDLENRLRSCGGRGVYVCVCVYRVGKRVMNRSFVVGIEMTVTLKLSAFRRCRVGRCGMEMYIHWRLNENRMVSNFYIVMSRFGSRIYDATKELGNAELRPLCGTRAILKSARQYETYIFRNSGLVDTMTFIFPDIICFS